MVSTTSGTPTVSGTSALDTFVNLSGLSDNTTYYINVRAVCSSSDSSNWEETSFTTLPSCIAPTALTSSTVGATSATISWTAPASPPAVGYEYVISTTAGTPTGAGTPVATGTSEMLTGLTPQTTYYAYVRGDCGGSQSSWISTTFTTACAATTVFPATADFTTFLPSACWSEARDGDLVSGPTGTFANWTQDDWLNNTSNTKSARVNIWGTGDDEWLISEEYTIPSGVGYRLAYDVAATQYNSTAAPSTPWGTDDTVQVLITTSGMSNWSELIAYNASNAPSNTGVFETIDLTSYAGQTIRIAFRSREGSSSGGDIDFFIDNVTIEEIPACESPLSLASSNVVAFTADISWTAPSTVPSNGYEYVVSTTRGMPMTNGTSVPSGTSVSLSGLTPNAQHYFYVRGDCGGVYSMWEEDSFMTIPSCLTPSALASSDVTGSGATISWTSSTSSPVNGYEYMVSPTRGVPMTPGTNVPSDTFVALSGLSPLTKYYFYVRSDCGGGDYSTWEEDSFTTDLAALACASGNPSNILTQDFDNGTTVARWVPTGWTRSSTSTSFGWSSEYNATGSGSTGPSGPYSSTGYLYLETSSGAQFDRDTLTSPSIDLSSVAPGGSARLQFRYHMYGANMGDMFIAVNDAGTIALLDSIKGQQHTSSNDPWSVKEVDLTVYTANPIQILIIGEKGNTTATFDGDMAIDAFIVEGCVGCVAPTALIPTAVSDVSATISWTAPTPAPFGYEYVVSTTAGTPTGAGTPVAAGTSEVLTGLSPQTTYYAYVRSDCGGQASSWIETSFTTDCSPASVFPAIADFSTFLPSACWSEAADGDLVNGPTGSSSNWLQSDWLNNSANSQAARVNIWGTGDDEWLVSEEYAIPSGVSYRLTYEVGATQFAATTAPTTAWGTDDTVQVLITTSGMTNWTELIAYNAANVPSHQGQSEQIDLTPYAGQTIRVAFRSREGSTSGGDIDFFIDDFTVEETPSCLEPIALTSSAITNVSATLGWTAPATAPSVGYEYAVSTTRAMPVGSGTQEPTTSAAVAGLSASTKYYFYIRSDCGGGDYSTWVEDSFSTAACSPADVCKFYFDLADSYSDGWDGSVMGVYQNGALSGTFGSNFTSGGSHLDSLQLCKDEYTVIVPVNVGSYTSEKSWDVKTNNDIVLTTKSNSSFSAGDTLGEFFSQCGTCKVDASTVLAYNSSATAVTYNADKECLDSLGWTHYFRDNAGTNELLLSLKKNSNNIGFLKDGSFALDLGSGSGAIDQSAAAYNVANNYWQVMNRWFDVTPSTQPSSNVGVRFYYTTADYNDISTAINGDSVNSISAHTDVKHFKFLDGTNANPNAAGHAAVTEPNFQFIQSGSAAATDSFVYAAIGAYHVAEYEVTSFSGGGGGGSGGAGPVPVELIYFDAYAVNTEDAKLEWATASELNNDRFEIYRSYNGVDYEYVNTVTGNGTTSKVMEYALVDRGAARGGQVVYYTIKQVDYDGTFEYTEVRKVLFDGKGSLERQVTVYPNPFTSHFVVSADVNSINPVQLSILDVQGKVLQTELLSDNVGRTNTVINTNNLPTGVYFIKIEVDGLSSTHRLIKSR